MAQVLNHLRTSPPPRPSPLRPLLPNSPPPSHLPFNPVIYLTVILDSVAPLLRIRQIKGAAGGGLSLPMPTPLLQRQRRRQAIQWILEAVSKKQNRGSGRGTFAHRLGEELVAVAEGKSSVWERRGTVHKLAVTSRANVGTRVRVKKRK
jgi:small subunit ribosomal protein S7